MHNVYMTFNGGTEMTNDPIQAWLNAAGRYPMLPKLEIIRLAKKRATLPEGSAAYVKIVNKICQHNLRLIPGIVARYVSKRKGVSMNSPVISDLLQQGYVGLRRAAEKYDASRGYTFSTYASSWIYQAFYRWHNSKDRAIYIPENAVCEMLYRYRHGEPSKSKNGRIGEDVMKAAQRSATILSIDVPLEDDSESTFVDVLCEDNLLLDSDSDSSDWAARQLDTLMNNCGIKPRVQKIVRTYARKGNMMSTAYQLGISRPTCQNLYQEAVSVMKEKVDSGAVRMVR